MADAAAGHDCSLFCRYVGRTPCASVATGSKAESNDRSFQRCLIDIVVIVIIIMHSTETMVHL